MYLAAALVVNGVNQHMAAMSSSYSSWNEVNASGRQGAAAERSHPESRTFSTLTLVLKAFQTELQCRLSSAAARSTMRRRYDR